MNFLSNISNKLKTVQNSIGVLISVGVESNEEQIRNWIRNRWLTGKDSEGNAIGFYRFEDYAEQKNVMNSFAGFGNVDLTYTGLMGKSIEISNFNGDYQVTSSVSYYDKIIEKYGEINFNITDAEKQKLNDIIFIVIFNEINKSYG